MDHYQMRYYLKLYCFVAFSVLCFVAEAACIAFAFVYPDVKGVDYTLIVTILTLYVGVFKLILPSKTDAYNATPASSLSRFHRTPSPPETPQRVDRVIQEPYDKGEPYQLPHQTP